MRELLLIGLPTDSHSSFMRGAAKAPPLIRAALYSDHSNLASEGGIDLGTDLCVRDGGDLALSEGPDDAALIQAAAFDAAKAGTVPLFLGGDHMISFPAVRGIVEAVGMVDILHFDAHPDLYDDFGGDPLSHASPFARIMEQGLAGRLVQVGIRTLNAHCRAQAERFGVEIVPIRGFHPQSVPIPSGRPLYVSIDLDALDPAFAPGVSHHEPGGLTSRDIVDVLARIGRPIVGADIVEYNPDRDINGMTATVAAKFIKELCGLCGQEKQQ